MKELAAILIVWQATPVDQPYQPEPTEIVLCTERIDNKVCSALKDESNESR
jgi:hypothetical protein